MTEPWRDWRVLWVGNGSPDLGSDALFDGLKTVLGPRCIDYQGGAHLHVPPDEEASWPSRYAWPLPDILDASDLRAMLHSGAFDLVVLSSERPRVVAAAQALRIADETVPCVLTDFLDPQESGRGPLPPTCCTFYAQPDSPHAGSGIPLPYSFPERWVSETEPRDHVVFFNGVSSPSYPRDAQWQALRDAGIPCEGGFTGGLPNQMPFRAFLARLGAVTVAWCPPNAGWESMRYWEAAAHGCCLVADYRTGDTIPNAISPSGAIYYDGIPDLIERVRAVVGLGATDPTQARVMGQSARAQYLASHTTAHRAEQLLTHVYERCLR